MGSTIFPQYSDASWVKNSVAAMSGDELQLINNAGSDFASAIQNSTITGLEGRLHSLWYISGTADNANMGMLDSAQPTTSVNSSGGMVGVTGFWGIDLDIYNDKVWAVRNGARGNSVNFDATDNAFYQEITVEFEISGSNMIIRCYRNSVLLLEDSGTAPSFTQWRPALGARTGGATGYFRAWGPASWVPKSSNRPRFIQQTRSAAASGGATVPGCTLAQANDLQVLAVVHHPSTSVTTPSGWTFLDSVASTHCRVDLYTRVATAGNATSPQAVTWGDMGRIMMLTYRNSSSVSVLSKGSGLVNSSQTVPNYEVLYRLFGSASSSSDSAAKQFSLPRENHFGSSGTEQFTWYTFVGGGEDPASDGDTAASRTAFATSGTQYPVYMDLRVQGLNVDLTSAPAPANVVSTRLTHNETRVSFDEVAGASGYEYRLNGGSAAPLGSAPYDITGLTPGTTYAIEVRGVNAITSTSTAWSTAINVTTDTLSAYMSEVLVDAPAVYHPLQEASGTLMLDYSGNKRDGTYVGGVALQDTADPEVPSSFLRKHVRLDGTDDHLLLDPSSWFNPAGTGFTLEMHIRIRTWEQYARILDFANAASTADMYFIPSGASSVWQWRTNGTDVQPSPRTDLNRWMHLVWTVTSAGVGQVWIDGALFTSGNTGAPTAGTRAYKYIGRSSYPGDPYLDASLAHVAIYHSVLSDARKIAHFNASQDLTGKTVTGADVVAYSGGARISWAALPGATGYEYRVDGGSVSTATSPLTLSGLTDGTTYNLEVRGVNSINGTTGSWTSILVKPVTTLLLDFFDRAAVAPSTTALGAPVQGPASTNWSQQLNIGINASGQAYSTASGENLAWIPNLGWDVEIDLQQVNLLSSWIIFRFRDVNNYWLFGGTNNELYRRAGGAFRLMRGARYNNAAITMVANQRIKVVTNENQIRCYVNGKQRIEWADEFGVEATDKGVGFRLDTTTSAVDWIEAQAFDITRWPNLNATMYTVLGQPAVSPNYQSGWLYKGRNTKTLDTGSVV